MTNVVKTKFNPSTSNLRWRPFSEHGDLRTEIAFDGDRVHRRQTGIAAATAAALDANKEAANSNPSGYGVGRTLKRIAHLTPATIMWLREHKGIDIFNPDHEPALRRILNDSEFRYLRTSTGSF